MSSRRGFTLLEVMVAMAILAMGMTIILSSQAGLFAATKRIQDETHAASLMRCRMSEIEEELMRDGFPLIERNDSGDCCEGEDSEFRCEWTIQIVELPQPATFDEFEEGEGEDESEAASAFGAPGAGVSPLGTPLGDAAAISPMHGSALGEVEGMGDLAGTLGDSAEGGGMIGMALGLVYPTLKPMLEASIRKVHVSVLWDEGSKVRSFEAVQYITNPLEGGLNPNADEGMEELMEKLGGGVLGGINNVDDDVDDAGADGAPAEEVK